MLRRSPVILWCYYQILSCFRSQFHTPALLLLPSLPSCFSNIVFFHLVPRFIPYLSLPLPHRNGRQKERGSLSRPNCTSPWIPNALNPLWQSSSSVSRVPHNLSSNNLDNYTSIDYCLVFLTLMFSSTKTPFPSCTYREKDMETEE